MSSGTSTSGFSSSDESVSSAQPSDMKEVRSPGTYPSTTDLNTYVKHFIKYGPKSRDAYCYPGQPRCGTLGASLQVWYDPEDKLVKALIFPSSQHAEKEDLGRGETDTPDCVFIEKCRLKDVRRIKRMIRHYGAFVFEPGESDCPLEYTGPMWG